MYARDVMTREVPTISLRKTVAEAIRLIKSNVGDDSFRNAAPGLVVVNERGEFAGIFTPLLVITRFLEEARHQPPTAGITPEYLASLASRFETTTVASVMERQAISVTEEALVTDVAELFATHRFQRIPVVSGKKVIGIIYRSRLMFALTASLTAR